MPRFKLYTLLHGVKFRLSEAKVFSKLRMESLCLRVPSHSSTAADLHCTSTVRTFVPKTQTFSENPSPKNQGISQTLQDPLPSSRQPSGLWLLWRLCRTHCNRKKDRLGQYGWLQKTIPWTTRLASTL